MRRRRRALTAAERRESGESVAELITGLAEFRDASHIAVYAAVDGELDPSALVELARAAGKFLYLPVVSAASDGELDFARWQAEMPLYPNRFRIPEPHVTAENRRAPALLDLVCVPLLAFDAHGHRLGTGGGYYDRSFAFLKPKMHKPRLIGLGYEFQHLPSLDAANWDVPLAAAVTERGIYRFAN